MRTLVLLAALAASPAMAQVNIENAWARATPPGAKVAAGYMMIRSAGDRLIAVNSSAAERVEMHVTERDGDVARMKQVKAYDVQGAFELKPGAAHLMFVNIKAPFKEGEKIPVVLRFEKAGEVKAQFHVGRITAGGGQHHQHKGH
jgi:periplasmic copper chaperone A